MSNKLITDSFPKTKKDKLITQKLQQVKPKTADVQAKPSDIRDAAIDNEAQELAVLKKFDMTSEFGPCIGISRLERWDRADKYGLNPPPEVKKVISLNPNNNRYTDCIWSGEKL